MLYDTSGYSQPMLQRGRIVGSYGTPVMYPSPFFDIGHTYLPHSLQELFRWCKYYFLTNSIIHTIVTKLATYPITEIVIDEEQDTLRKRWEDFLHKDVRIRSFQLGVGLDYHAFGNGMASMAFPFNKFLGCPSCGAYEHVGNADYTYRGFEFYLKCKNCGGHNKADAKDSYVRMASKIRLFRWNPDSVEIEPSYGKAGDIYHVRPASAMFNDLVAGRKEVIENTPQMFLRAAKENKAVAISSENVYHMKRESISSDYTGWGVSRIMSVLKDAFLMQLMKKATECVAPSTLIETRSGLMSADEVPIGALVRTHKGRWRPVVDKWYRDKRDDEAGVEITVSCMRPLPSIYSGDHPILTLRRNKLRRRKDTKEKQAAGVILRKPHLYEEVICPAKQFDVGDYVLYPRRLPVGEQIVDVERYTGLPSTGNFVYSGCGLDTARDYERLERGESIRDRRSNPARAAIRAFGRDHPPKRMPSKIKMTADFAYILGWYAGDGSCGARHVTFDLGLDDDYEALVAAVRRSFGVACTARKSRTGKHRHVTASDVILRLLIKGMIPGTARTKRVPVEILNGTDEIKTAFLKGLLEADGHYEQRRASLSTTSRELMYSSFRLLLHLGCIPSASEDPKHRECTLDNGWVIKSGPHFAVLTCGPSAKRLYSLFDGIVPDEEVGAGKTGFFWKNYFAARVSRVRVRKAEQYIDFKVDEDATFCTPATATKNCILAEHVVPLRLLFPSVAGPSQDVYKYADLSRWKENVNLEINQWRLDPNRIGVLPLPLGMLSVGGDGKAMMLFQELREMYEMLAVGMGVPREFVFGGLSFCLHPDTLVVGKRGLVSAGSLCPTDPGRVYQNNGMSLLTPEGLKGVAITHNNGTHNGKRIVVDGGVENVCADTHPYLVLKPDMSMDWVTAGKLKIGDYVASMSGMDQWPKTALRFGYTPSDECKRSESVAIPSKVSNEFARLLGYIISEGTIRRCEITIPQKDEKITADIVRCAEASFGFKPAVHKRTVRGSDYNIVAIYSKRVVDFMRWCGAAGLSYQKEIPWVILQSKKGHVAEFIKAYIEGDGHVPKRKKKQYITAASVSKKLFHQLQLLLMNFGISPRIYRQERGGNCRTIYRLNISSDEVDIYTKAIGFISEEKWARLKERSGVKPTAKRDSVIPHLREAINTFCDRHWPGKNVWVWEPLDLKATKAYYTTEEIGDLLGRSASMVGIHIRAGRLKATQQVVNHNLTRYVVEAGDLEKFCREYGRGKRRKRARRWTWRGGRCDKETLGWIRERDNVLAERIEAVQDSMYTWKKIEDIQPAGQIPTVDFTLAGPHIYWSAGLISHNSGTSVSLRMLENDFLRYMEEQQGLLDWVIDRTSIYMGWPKVEAHHRPFKMADDLNRVNLALQMRQMGDISRHDLHVQAGLDPEATSKQLKKERSLIREESRAQAQAQAEAEGELMLTQSRYQVKAQEIQNRMMMESGQPGGMQQEAPGGQVGGVDHMVQGLQGGPGIAVNPAMTPEGGGDPASVGYDLRKVVPQLVGQIRENPQAAPELMQRLQAEYPQVFQQVMAALNPLQPAKALPEQRPPRRSAERALI